MRVVGACVRACLCVCGGGSTRALASALLAAASAREVSRCADSRDAALLLMAFSVVASSFLMSAQRWLNVRTWFCSRFVAAIALAASWAAINFRAKSASRSSLSASALLTMMNVQRF